MVLILKMYNLHLIQLFRVVGNLIFSNNFSFLIYIYIFKFII